MSPRSVGFPPLAGPAAKVLILGSLPGAESLRRREYYAQPQNTFWRIMGELWGFRPAQPYRARTLALIAAGVALWDVCASAQRSGSLDAAIELASVRTNDFAAFYVRQPAIRLICFNGAKAWQLYRTRVLPSLDPALKVIATRVLPSTSPAHASLPYPAKKSAWKIVCMR